MDVASSLSSLSVILTGVEAMSINDFEYNAPTITMGADVRTLETPHQGREEQLELRLQRLEIEEERPVNICVIEAALASI